MIVDGDTIQPSLNKVLMDHVFQKTASKAKDYLMQRITTKP
jgi:hypothetical protein